MNLDALLKQLESSYGSESLSSTGASASELEERFKSLAPYVVPDSLKELYLWRDGLGETELAPGMRFYSLEEALSSYQTMLELSGVEGWCPIWFPAFGYEGDCYCLELSKEKRPDSRLWSFLAEETECTLHLDSVAALTLYAYRGWSEEVFTFREGYPQADHPRESRLRSEFCSQEIAYARFPEPGWPPEWTEALGRGEHKLEGATHTIAQALAQKKTLKTARVVGRVVSLLGGSEGTWVKLADNSGEVTIECPRQVPGSGQLRMEDSFEVTLEPHPSKPGFLARLTGWPAPFKASRVVLVKQRP